MIKFNFKNEYIDSMSPFLYGAFMFIAIPFSILILIISSILLLIFWPVLPIAAYFQRKAMLDDNYIDEDLNND